MPKIDGLEDLGRQLEEAQIVLSSLEGDLGTITFDPADPGSTETALSRMRALVDGRLGAYVDNPIVGPLVDKSKDRYRQMVLGRAAAARVAAEDPK